MIHELCTLQYCDRTTREGGGHMYRVGGDMFFVNWEHFLNKASI